MTTVMQTDRQTGDQKHYVSAWIFDRWCFSCFGSFPFLSHDKMFKSSNRL